MSLQALLNHAPAVRKIVAPATPPRVNQPKGKDTLHPRDVFISHAALDNATYIRPLREALRHRGVSFWLSDIELEDGFSLTTQVGEGLEKADIVVVLLTPAFLESRWSDRELRCALAKDLSAGNQRVLPIFDVEYETAFRHYPLLRDMRGPRWSNGPDALADRIFARLNRYAAHVHHGYHPTTYRGPTWIRITPEATNFGKPHHVRITRDNRLCERVLEVGGEPISLLQHKEQDTKIDLEVRVDPPAIVTFGQGKPQDYEVVNIDEDWRDISADHINL